MSEGKARLPRRWIIESFWNLHRRIVRASRGRDEDGSKAVVLEPAP